jgi:ubiquinone/menaquinone biosynthesis C-methylase UbiE
VTYLFGHSADETDRLLRQARLFGPYTRRLLEDAGIAPGMKVLDVGSGAGDVSLLLADMVGMSGTVMGVDINAELLETARARADAAGLRNVTFTVGDAASAALAEDFDAVVGRCVLFS